jgi:hypothetical protein
MSSMTWATTWNSTGFLTANESYAVGAKLEDLLQPFAQPRSRHCLLIEFQRAVRQNLYNHHIRIRPWLRIRTLLGYLHLHTPRVRDDHEDHQQNQQNIDERNHVHFRECSASNRQLTCP